VLAIEFGIMDLGSTEKGLVYPSGQRKGAKSPPHSLQNCKASLVRTQLLYPLGVRENAVVTKSFMAADILESSFLA